MTLKLTPHSHLLFLVLPLLICSTELRATGGERTPFANTTYSALDCKAQMRYIPYNRRRYDRFDLFRLEGGPFMGKLHFPGGKVQVGTLSDRFEKGLEWGIGGNMMLGLLKGRMSLNVGYRSIERSYLHQREGIFASNNLYGSINVRYDITYAGIPLSVGFHGTSGKTAFHMKFGYLPMFLNTVAVSANGYGNASTTERDVFAATPDDLVASNNMVSLQAGSHFYIFSSNLSIQLEPYLLFSPRSDRKGLDDRIVRQLVYGAQLGLSYGLDQGSVARWQQKRQEKQRKKLEEKERQLREDLERIGNNNPSN